MGRTIDTVREIPVFKGTPEEVGIRYAAVNKAIISDRFSLWLEGCKKLGLEESSLVGRASSFIEAAAEAAPWILAEAEGVSAALNLPPKLFLAYIASSLSTEGLSKDDGCTSILAVGKAAAGGQSILHKNRDKDNADPQALYIKEITYPGRTLNRFIGTSFVHDTGINAFINDKGLAGATNSGEPFTNSYTRGGLNSRSVLRILAETASSCEEVLETIVPILSKPGRYSFTKGTGTIWLFVDREKGLIIENTAHRVAFEYIYDDIAVRANDFILLDRDTAVGKLGRERPGGLVRRERTLKRLQAKKGSITPETVAGAARDWEPPVNTEGWSKEEVDAYLFPCICKARTVSGFTAVIPQEFPSTLPCARFMNGHPNNVYSLPLYIGCERIPEPHVNGEISMISYRLMKSNPVGANPLLNIGETEAAIWAETAVLEKEAKALLQEGKEEEAKELLTRKANEISRRAIGLMRMAGEKA